MPSTHSCMILMHRLKEILKYGFSMMHHMLNKRQIGVGVAYAEETMNCASLNDSLPAALNKQGADILSE